MAKALPSKPTRQLSFLAILIVVIATPATLALSYYHITGDPTFRPLALTVERLVARGITVEHIDVQGIITTDGSTKGNRDGNELAHRLNKAFYGKGLNSVFRLFPTPEQRAPKILLFVGGKRLGPFSIRSAPQAVRLAAEAVAIDKRDKARAAELHSW